MPVIRRLIWESSNLRHVRRHHVEPEEVEEVRSNRPLLMRRVGQRRYRATGVTDAGRYLTAFLDLRFDAVYYVVTARDASDWERRQYQRL